MTDKYMMTGTKLPWYPERIAKWMKGETIPPIHIELGITSSCNLKCIFCIDGDSNILMADFTYKKIKNINEGEKILGFDELEPKYSNYKMVYPSVVNKVFKRNEKVIKIILEDDKSIIITEEHKILSKRGHEKSAWREARKFKVGQKIKIFPYIPTKSCNIDSKDYKIGYLVGSVLGDGCLKHYHHFRKDRQVYNDLYRFRLAVKDSEMNNRVHRYLTEIGINTYIRGFDIHAKRDIEKFKPATFSNRKDTYYSIKSLINSNYKRNNKYDYYCGFLSGIYDAEGNISKHNIIRIGNTDRRLIDEVIVALNNINIPYVLDYIKKDKCKNAYVVRILSPKNKFNNLKFIQITNPAIKRKGIENFYYKVMSNSVKIKDIQEINKIDVYNIQTSTGTYIANNFYVHNCFGRYSGQDATHYDLPKRIIFKLFDDAKAIGVKSITLTGEGENTLHKDFYEIIQYAKSIGLDLALLTNGTMLRHDKIEELLKSFVYIRFSISGIGRSQYLKIQGKDMYDKVVDNIKRCADTKRKLGLNTTLGIMMVLLEQNIQDVIPFAELGKRLGVDYAVVKPCSDDPSRDIGVNAEKYLEMTDILQEAERYSTDDYSVIVKYKKLGNLGINPFNTCYGTAFSISINAHGNVAPCGNLLGYREAEFNMGNIEKQSFKDIVESKHYWDIQKKVQTLDVNKECETNCLHHHMNIYLDMLKHPPEHINFP